jgi:hypothetical protein
MRHGWNNLTGKAQVNLSRSTFPTKISTWTGLGLNPCLRFEKPRVQAAVLTMNRTLRYALKMLAMKNLRCFIHGSLQNIC